MERSPREVNSCLASQEIPAFHKKEVNGRVHKSLNVVSQINSIRVLLSYLTFHFNIINPSTPRSSQRSFLQVYQPNPARISLLHHTYHVPRPIHPPWSDHPNYIRWTVHTHTHTHTHTHAHKSLRSSWRSCPHSCSLVPLKPPKSLSATYSRTISVCSSINARHQVSDPYKRGNITVLYTYLWTANWRQNIRDRMSAGTLPLLSTGGNIDILVPFRNIYIFKRLMVYLNVVICTFLRGRSP